MVIEFVVRNSSALLFGRYYVDVNFLYNAQSFHELDLPVFDRSTEFHRAQRLLSTSEAATVRAVTGDQ